MNNINLAEGWGSKQTLNMVYL